MFWQSAYSWDKQISYSEFTLKWFFNWIFKRDRSLETTPIEFFILLPYNWRKHFSWHLPLFWYIKRYATPLLRFGGFQNKLFLNRCQLVSFQKINLEVSCQNDFEQSNDVSIRNPRPACFSGYKWTSDSISNIAFYITYWIEIYNVKV